MQRLKNLLQEAYLGLITLFLYAPILTLMVLSFNASKSRARWGGLSLDWYVQMFREKAIVAALKNTLVIALVAALAATLIGTLAALAISRMRAFGRGVLLGITNIPMLNADIVTGISLMLCFIAFGMTLGFRTILIAHITFSIPYVILSVMPKLKQTSQVNYEAAMDLGASPAQAFFKVVLPEIMPGILSGFLLAFTMSLDDFIITHFTKGAGINTISTLVYSQVRRGINPSMYALSTLIFGSIFVILLLANFGPEWFKKERERKELR